MFLYFKDTRKWFHVSWPVPFQFLISDFLKCLRIFYQQDWIPEWCLPPAHWPYFHYGGWSCSGREVLSWGIGAVLGGGAVLEGGGGRYLPQQHLPPGQYPNDHVTYPMMHLMSHLIPLSWTDRSLWKHNLRSLRYASGNYSNNSNFLNRTELAANDIAS